MRDALADLTPGERVLVALSGGPDSLALLAGTLVVGREQGLLVAAVVVDHGLQPGSAQVAARAAEQARILGCEDVRVTRVAVDQGPGSGGPEAAARRARYAELLREAGVGAADRVAGAGLADRVASDPAAVGDQAGAADPAVGDPAAGDPAGAGDPAAGTGEQASARERPTGARAVVLLGHTRDDQAETVLLGLARGSGTRSLAGMAGRRGPLRRPLLDLPRSVVHAAAAQAAADDPRLEPWLDPHNADRAFARGRVRAEAMPVLEATLGPGVVDALARSARLARADADALDAWEDEVWAHCRVEAPAHGRLPGEGRAPGQAHASDGGWSPPEGRAPGQAETAEEGWPPPDARASGEGGSPAATSAASPGNAAAGAPTWWLHWPPAGIATALPAPDTGSAPPPPAPPVAPLPWAIRTRVVRRFLLAAGCPAGSLTAEHVERVTALLDAAPGRAEVALPGGRRARREGSALAVRA